MKRSPLKFSAAAAALMIASFSAPAADPAACGACHGPQGISANPVWPNLAGQHASYIVSQLKSFKEGHRPDTMMAPQASLLDEAGMKSLGEHFAKLPTRIGSADPALVALGEQIYRAGNAETGVSACGACHGPAGKGNEGAGFPQLAGQHGAYTEKQLKLFRAGERGDPKALSTQMMHGVAKGMTDEEIAAVASFIDGLH